MKMLSNYVVTLTLTLILVIGSSFTTPVLAQETINDDQRLDLRQSAEYTRTMVRVVEAKLAPIEKAKIKFNEAKELYAEGSKYQAFQRVNDAATLFLEAYPDVDRSMKSYQNALLGFYSRCHGSAEAGFEEREKLDAQAKEVVLDMKRAEASGDKFLAEFYRLQVAELYVKSRGLQGAIGSEKVLAKLRTRIELSALSTQKQIVQLARVKFYMETYKTLAEAAGSSRVAELDGFGDIGSLNDFLEDMLGGSQEFSGAESQGDLDLDLDLPGLDAYIDNHTPNQKD